MDLADATLSVHSLDVTSLYCFNRECARLLSRSRTVDDESKHGLDESICGDNS